MPNSSLTLLGSGANGGGDSSAGGYYHPYWFAVTFFGTYFFN